MNNSQAQHIAKQALQALYLRRQLERGDLTHQEYVARLNALQGTPDQAAVHAPRRAMAEPAHQTGGSTSGQIASEPRPKLISALELLQLRRRLESGQLTSQEYLAQLNAQPDVAHLPVHEPAPLSASSLAAAPRMPAALAMVTTPVTLERSLAMKCPRCAANLSIYDRTTELQCSDCGEDIVVRRKDCTIALRLAGELLEDTEAIAPGAGAASTTTDKELKRLRAEKAMVINVKRATGILGGLWGVVFAYAGIVDMAARHTDIGTSVLVCGSALLGMVICITRHTNKVRGNLTVQIRAITSNEECAAALS